MNTSSRQFSCPSCAGIQAFDPSSQSLKCRFCGHSDDISSTKDQTIFKSSEQCYDPHSNCITAEDKPEKLSIIQCDGCAAKIEFDRQDRASKCPYCGTPIVSAPKEEEFLPLQGIIPFQVPEHDLASLLKNWLASRWFLPSGLTKIYRRTSYITGIYVPFWTYDADTHTHYRGERGTTVMTPKTVVMNGKSKTVMESKTHWRPKIGKVSQHFDDVLVCGSAYFPGQLVDQFQTWSLAPMRHFQDSYVAGFEAERHSISLADALDLAKEKMKIQITQSVKHDIGGDRQRVHSMRTQYARIRYRQILLPLWSTTYRHNGKDYTVLINGQTGEVRGERPLSIWKIFTAVLGIAAFVGLILGVGAYTGHFNLQEFRFQ